MFARTTLLCVKYIEKRCTVRKSIQVWARKHCGKGILQETKQNNTYNNNSLRVPDNKSLSSMLGIAQMTSTGCVKANLATVRSLVQQGVSKGAALMGKWASNNRYEIMRST